MNFWYLIVGSGFIGAGAYKIYMHNPSTGLVWVIIGVLFGLLARQRKHK